MYDRVAWVKHFNTEVPVPNTNVTRYTEQNQVSNEMKALWASAPALRYGQFLVNVITHIRGDFKSEYLFYITDTELVEGARDFVKNLMVPS